MNAIFLTINPIDKSMKFLQINSASDSELMKIIGQKSSSFTITVEKWDNKLTDQTDY